MSSDYWMSTRISELSTIFFYILYFFLYKWLLPHSLLIIILLQLTACCFGVWRCASIRRIHTRKRNFSSRIPFYFTIIPAHILSPFFTLPQIIVSEPKRKIKEGRTNKRGKKYPSNYYKYYLLPPLITTTIEEKHFSLSTWHKWYSLLFFLPPNCTINTKGLEVILFLVWCWLK